MSGYAPGAGLFGALVDAAPDRDTSAFVFLDGRGRVESERSFGGMLDAALRVGHRLRALGVGRGDRALILHRPGLDYVAAFYGCVSAGVVPVPLHPVRASNREHITAIVADCDPVIALADDRSATASLVGLSLPVLATADWPAADAETLRPTPGSESSEVAYVQYSVGPTGRPIGATVDHGEAVARCRDLAELWQVGADSVIVSWLPLSMDFGLLSGVLLPVTSRCQVVTMAPATFLRDPVRWLEAISRYRGTHSGATNSAYDHCVDVIGESDRTGVDLSSWRQVGFGPEPIRVDTMQRFRSAFADCGLASSIRRRGEL